MAIDTEKLRLPVIQNIEDFDRQSGDWLERLVFNYRIWIVLIVVAVTILLGWHAARLTVQASFDEMIPQSHPYIQNYFKYKNDLKGLGNSLRIVVENPSGDIFEKDYLNTVRKINDILFLTPGVDRAFMRSLWTPIVRWTEVTEEGFQGGPVMPFDYDDSPAAIETLKQNVSRAGLRGTLVGRDFKSSMIFVPLMDTLPDTGELLNYSVLSTFLEKEIREKFQFAESLEEKANAQVTFPYRIHIVGFVKLVGDLIDGLKQVILFFGLSALIASLVIYLYTRDLRSTLLLVLTATIGVIWLLGLLQILGYDLNPYSILVPFLIFAIGLSHGAQKMNGIMQDIGRGTHKYVAARYTFRRLFLTGLTALITNVVGFAVLMIIDIPVIRQLAMTTSIGVLVLIFTKLFFIPVALSYIGVSRKAAERSLISGTSSSAFDFLRHCCTPRIALPMVTAALIIGAAASALSLTSLKMGDLDTGAPELRPDSRYNQDVAYINEHYGLSNDQFAIIVKTPNGGIRSYDTLVEQDRLAWELQQLPSVLTTASVSGGIRQVAAGIFEGSPKWMTIPRNEQTSGNVTQNLLVGNPELMNTSASVAPVIAYLKDHRADTLREVSRTVEDFAARHNTENRQFLLAAGSAGIEAATNDMVQKANYQILGLLYAAVATLCLITFRSWRAVIVAMVPLVITSFLCEALMVLLGIGVKVATLPVIALGVGVGVDYALYLLSVQLAAQRRGVKLAGAYSLALNFTGRVVALIGITMAAGVITWAWSPIKFQADMGILLTFMFLWNMVGSLILIPALSCFLLRDIGEEKRLEAQEISSTNSPLDREELDKEAKKKSTVRAPASL
ncbi:MULTISPECIES: efflux RND transporter permease subunit [Pseudomonas]|uniref:efflux RND transporter permease subunit n=1 Tax=Pseudomonas nitroreducens TaxID=46680 RepID=UPI001E502B1D|nr:MULTISPECIES: MMPL family transporter [Pseudomonas]MCE4071510.1 MMPL family transporter [Pseudomonas nitritireducens]MCE4081286.1 MMPL family transporter [Pseudomonas nitroreducens]